MAYGEQDCYTPSLNAGLAIHTAISHPNIKAKGAHLTRAQAAS